MVKKSKGNPSDGTNKKNEDNTTQNEQPDKKRRDKTDKPAKKRRYRQAKKDELFDYQPTGSEALPPAKEFVEMFVPQVLETIHGLREIRTCAKNMNQTVFNAIEARAVSARLRSQVAKEPSPRPVFALGNVIISEPRDGVCEAAAVVRGPTRVRAVALRLEGLDNNWKATSFRML